MNHLQNSWILDPGMDTQDVEGFSMHHRGVFKYNLYERVYKLLSLIFWGILACRDSHISVVVIFRLETYVKGVFFWGGLLFFFIF